MKRVNDGYQDLLTIEKIIRARMEGKDWGERQDAIGVIAELLERVSKENVVMDARWFWRDDHNDAIFEYCIDGEMRERRPDDIAETAKKIEQDILNDDRWGDIVKVTGALELVEELIGEMKENQTQWDEEDAIEAAEQKAYDDGLCPYCNFEDCDGGCDPETWDDIPAKKGVENEKRC